MKKILLLSFIGVALVGCGQKEITNEFLVGEWSCNYSEYKAPWKDGKFSDYIKGTVEEGKVKYYMNGNTLMVTYDNDNGNTRPFDLDEIRKVNGKEETNYRMKTKTLVEMNYISQDEFVFNEITEVTTTDGSNEENENYNNKHKNEMACKRIK